MLATFDLYNNHQAVLVDEDTKIIINSFAPQA
jgi:hypothetical protein